MPRTSPDPRTSRRARRATCLLIGAPLDTAGAAAILGQETIELEALRSPEEVCGDPALAGAAIAILIGDGSARELAQAIRGLTAALPEAAVILIGKDLERWEVRSALAAGAAGVLLDDGNLERALPCTLDAVLAGQICVPREHARQLEPPALSAREKQILGLVVMGYMNCQIAEQLFLAESTVKSHLSSAFAKLGVRSRNEAARLILDPERGFGTGILGLSGAPREPSLAGAR